MWLHGFDLRSIRLTVAKMVVRSGATRDNCFIC